MLTAADIADLRRLEREWITSNRCVPSHRAREAFESRLRNHASDLLSAAEALLKIKAAYDEDPEILTERAVSTIVETFDELDHPQPPALTDLAATLPHLDSGELADAGRLVGHGRRGP